MMPPGLVITLGGVVGSRAWVTMMLLLGKGAEVGKIIGALLGQEPRQFGLGTPPLLFTQQVCPVLQPLFICKSIFGATHVPAAMQVPGHDPLLLGVWVGLFEPLDV